MKTKGKAWQLVVTVLLIVVFVYTAFFGVAAKYGDVTTTYIKGAKDIRFGVDIKGGVNGGTFGQLFQQFAVCSGKQSTGHKNLHSAISLRRMCIHDARPKLYKLSDMPDYKHTQESVF